VKKTFSMPEKSARKIEEYSKALGLTESGFVSLMVNQIGQVLTGLDDTPTKTKKREAGRSGSD